MTDRSLQMDDAGYPHIAYGGDHLYYAWRDGGGWHYETVDTAPEVGYYASLALDGDGYPHISYQDGGSGDLKCAYKDAAGWHVEPVDSVGGIGGEPSFHLDGDGFPHASYYDVGQYGGGPCLLRYSYRDASGWHSEVVDSDGGDTSLDLGAGGYPHLAYRDKYAYRDVAGWHIRTVTGNPGSARSLVLDARGGAHIAYGGWYQLKYAFYLEADHTLYLPIVRKSD